MGRFPRVTHPSAAHPEGCARLACVKPAASVRSEPGSNSHVENLMVWLLIWSRLNRREHSHLDTDHPKTTSILVDLFSRNVSAKVSFGTIGQSRPKVPRALRRPRFSFFSICNCQRTDTAKTQCRSHPAQSAQARRVSLSSGSLDVNSKGKCRSELLRRRRRRRPRC